MLTWFSELTWWQWTVLVYIPVAIALVLWSRSKGWQKAQECKGAKLAPPTQAEALLD